MNQYSDDLQGGSSVEQMSRISNAYVSVHRYVSWDSVSCSSAVD